MLYPTKKQILKNKPNLDAQIIQATLDWKKDYFPKWRYLSKKEQIKRLSYLIFLIHATATANQNLFIEDDIKYQYDQKTKTIYNNIHRPSIISSLHELGHHIYGKNETKACIWSVHLFQTCFPQSYKKLKWKDHLLIKK